MKKSINFLIRVLLVICTSFFTIGIAVISVLNITSIYQYAINKYNLTSIGEISNIELMSDYKILIKYLQNPFIKDLKMNNFPTSTDGAIHFYEVKKIFLIIYIALFIIALIFIATLIIKRKKEYKKEVYKIFNYSANLLSISIISLLICVYIDFSKTFIMFHKIFFNNNYWLFDPVTDPIINVLPEEVFQMYALIIFVLIIILIVVYKVLFYRNNKNKVNRINIENNSSI
ncbi:TIGR01906 family membrane protein [Clostridium carnis]